MDRQLILFYICQTNLNDRSQVLVFSQMLKKAMIKAILLAALSFWDACPGFADGSQCVLSYPASSFWDQLVVAQPRV